MNALSTDVDRRCPPGGVKVSNGLVKGFLSFPAMYLSNIIWGLEFELIAFKKSVK